MSCVALRPQCKCGVYMELRGSTGAKTPEQQYCGVWYDHPQIRFGSLIGHNSSILLPSTALNEMASA